MAGNASSNGAPRIRGANPTSRITRIHHEKCWIDGGEADGSRPRVPASEGRKTGPSVPIRKEKIVRHETKNLQIIVAEGFFEPNRINLQQKDDYPHMEFADEVPI